MVSLAGREASDLVRPLSWYKTHFILYASAVCLEIWDWWQNSSLTICSYSSLPQSLRLVTKLNSNYMLLLLFASIFEIGDKTQLELYTSTLCLKIWDWWQNSTLTICSYSSLPQTLRLVTKLNSNYMLLLLFASIFEIGDKTQLELYTPTLCLKIWDWWQNSTLTTGGVICSGTAKQRQLWGCYWDNFDKLKIF